MNTLNDLLIALDVLADEKDASLSTQIQLEEGGGATLFILWEAEDLPLEASAYFADDNQWSFGLVTEPLLFMNAVDEGLDDEKAADHAMRMVEAPEALLAYLARKPYDFVRAKSNRVDTITRT